MANTENYSTIGRSTIHSAKVWVTSCRIQCLLCQTFWKIWGVATFISERVLSGVSRFSQNKWCFCFGHPNMLWKWVIFLFMTHIFQYKHGLQSWMNVYGINQNPSDQINDIYDGNWYTTLFWRARLGLNVISRRLLFNDKFTLPMLYINSPVHPYLQPIGEEFWSWRFCRYTTCIIQTSKRDQTDGCRVAPTAFIIYRNLSNWSQTKMSWLSSFSSM